jgi:ribokinase
MSMPSFDAIGLGALNVDRIYSVPRVITDGAELIQECTAEAGGSAANTVYALAKLGLRCGFVGAVGDQDADIVLSSFTEVGVDTSRIVHKASAGTATVFAFADPAGRRAMYVYPGANALFAPGDVDASYVADGRLLVISSFAGEVPLAVQKVACRRSRDSLLPFRSTLSGPRPVWTPWPRWSPARPSSSPTPMNWRS